MLRYQTSQWCCLLWIYCKRLHIFVSKEVMQEMHILLIYTNVWFLIDRSLGWTREQFVVLCLLRWAIFHHSSYLLWHHLLICILMIRCWSALVVNQSHDLIRNEELIGECVEVGVECIHLEYECSFWLIVVYCVEISIWIRSCCLVWLEHNHWE